MPRQILQVRVNYLWASANIFVISVLCFCISVLALCPGQFGPRSVQGIVVLDSRAENVSPHTVVKNTFRHDCPRPMFVDSSRPRSVQDRIPGHKCKIHRRKIQQLQWCPTCNSDSNR
jgi:hypothetical protein